MFNITAFALFCFAFSSITLADEGHHRHRGHHGGRNYGPGERYYYERAPQYAPPPPPRYNSYDQRSHQGLAGGVIGSVLGYELGAGNPIASGLGAAAGSYLGNGMAR
jgi:hypothetical protein